MSKEYSEDFIGSVKTLRREAEEKLKENRYYIAIQKLDEILETERMFARDQQAEQAAEGAEQTPAPAVSAGTEHAAGATATRAEADTREMSATTAELTGAAAMATIAGTGAAVALHTAQTAPEPAVPAAQVPDTAPESSLFESTAPDAGEIAQSAAVEALSDDAPAAETTAANPEQSRGSRSRIIPHWWRGQGGGATTDRPDQAGAAGIDGTAGQTDHKGDSESSWIAKGTAAVATGAAGVAAVQAVSSPDTEQTEAAAAQLRDGLVEDVVEVSGTGRVHETIDQVAPDQPQSDVATGFDAAGSAIIPPGVHIPDPVEPRVVAEAVAPDSFVVSEPVPEAIVSDISADIAETTLTDEEGADSSGGLVTETVVAETGADAAAAGMAAIHTGPGDAVREELTEAAESTTADTQAPSLESGERGRVEVIEAAPTAPYQTRTPDQAAEIIEPVVLDETTDAAAAAPASSAIETAKSDWEEAVALAAKPESAIAHISGETANAPADLDAAPVDSSIAVVAESGFATETVTPEIAEENIAEVAQDSAASIAEPPAAETIVAQTISSNMETEPAVQEMVVPEFEPAAADTVVESMPAAMDTVTKSVPDVIETVTESVATGGEDTRSEIDLTTTAAAAAATVTAAAGTATVAGRAFGAQTADVRIERQEDAEDDGVVDAVFDEPSPTAAVAAGSSAVDRETFLRRVGDDSVLGTAPRKGFLRRLVSGLTRDD